jgi:hypothetical protein
MSPPSSFTSVAERLSGTTWTMQALPHEPGGNLEAVSCSSVQSCLAVGTINERDGTLVQLAEYFNGISWVVVPTPTTGTQSSLSSVSCVSSGSCIAVGQTGGQQHPLVERFDGRNLTIVAVPPPEYADPEVFGSKYSGAVLQEVSCASSSSCDAIGWDEIALQTAGGFAEHWDGTSWHLEAYPAPANSVYYNGGLSCTAGGCIALGYGTHAPYMMRFDGTSWTLAPFTMVPHLRNYPAFRSLSCTSLVLCTVVGIKKALVEPTLLLRFNGTTWRTQPMPRALTRTQRAGLAGISCPNSHSCTAVGSLANEPLAIRTGAG